VPLADATGIRAALRALGFAPEVPRPVLVMVGGAGSMSEESVGTVRALSHDVIFPVVAGMGGVVVGGGTGDGVPGIAGEYGQSGEHRLALGTVARGTILPPDGSGRPEAWPAPLGPGYSAFISCPGDRWGDEIGLMNRAADAITHGNAAYAMGSATLLANGGPVSMHDVEAAIGAGRPVIALGGTGRLADWIGATQRAAEHRAAAGDARLFAEMGDNRERVAAMGLHVRWIEPGDVSGLRDALTTGLHTVRSQTPPDRAAERLREKSPVSFRHDAVGKGWGPSRASGVNPAAHVVHNTITARGPSQTSTPVAGQSSEGPDAKGLDLFR